ncbi:hypothetical protein RF11_15187 [Thelohanellus kitauei]|uniref:Uncharacterized protein n=1 Tax=Thelohanellus kitauei TaxID=669202 RepID=A0A0C2JTF2_THEKT|nr:hypothetical protein RF11_15187 [Thelohanellus kitauei]
MSDTWVFCFIEDENQRTTDKKTVYSPQIPITDMYYFDVIIAVPSTRKRNQNILTCKCPFPLYGPRCQYKKGCVNCAEQTSNKVHYRGLCRIGWSGKECKQRECFKGFCLHGGNY